MENVTQETKKSISGAIKVDEKEIRPLGVVRDHQGLPEGLPMLYYLNFRKQFY